MPITVEKEDTDADLKTIIKQENMDANPDPNPDHTIIYSKDNAWIIYKKQGQNLRVDFEPAVSNGYNCVWYKKTRDPKMRKSIIDLGDDYDNISVQGGIIKFKKLRCKDSGIYELELCGASKMNISVVCSFGLMVKSTDINWKKVGVGVGIGAGVTAGAAILAAPLAIAAIGFGPGGIVGGSWAAAWMSSAAVANGGATAAGSAVAVMQSVGAAGMGAAGTAGVGAAGATAGAGVGAAFSKLVKSDAEKKYEEEVAWMKEQLGISESEDDDKLIQTKTDKGM